MYTVAVQQRVFVGSGFSGGFSIICVSCLKGYPVVQLDCSDSSSAPCEGEGVPRTMVVHMLFCVTRDVQGAP